MRSKAERAMSCLGLDINRIPMYRDIAASEIGFTYRTNAGHVNISRRGGKYELVVYVENPPADLCPEQNCSYEVKRTFDTVEEACAFIKRC